MTADQALNHIKLHCYQRLSSDRGHTTFTHRAPASPESSSASHQALCPVLLTQSPCSEQESTLAQSNAIGVLGAAWKPAIIRHSWAGWRSATGDGCTSPGCRVSRKGWNEVGLSVNGDDAAQAGLRDLSSLRRRGRRQRGFDLTHTKRYSFNASNCVCLCVCVCVCVFTGDP